MSGADLSNVVNQAALYAAKHSKDIVEQEDLEYALDKVRMGELHRLLVGQKLAMQFDFHLMLFTFESWYGSLCASYYLVE